MTSITSAGSSSAWAALAAQGTQPPSPPPNGRPGGSDPVDGVTTGSTTSRQQQAVASLADLLGTDPDGLLAELSGGSDLSDMLRDRGVTRAAAAATVGEGFLVDRTG